MKWEKLLAKSIRDGETLTVSHTLLGHLGDALAAARAVLDAAGSDQLAAAGLDVSKWLPRLRRAVEVAAACHDLGKANDQFQHMVWGDPPSRVQGVRHEWVSVWLLAKPEWRSWLGRAFESPGDLDFVEWAVAGHHPAHHHASPPADKVDGSTYTEVEVLAGHANFASCLRWLESELGPGAPPSSDERVSLLGTRRENLFRWAAGWFDQASDRWRRLGDEERRFVGVVKACLIGADVAGSALPQTALPAGQRWAWVGEAFQITPTGEELAQLVKFRLGDQEPRPFQQAGAASEKRVTFVKAGCGSGKTALAYLWAARRWPGRRLYVCYPTTGTASEGFRGYLVDEEDENNPRARFGARLFHSRANIDLDMLGLKEDEDDDFLRIESLQAWSTPIVCCTTDTVLGLMQNQRRGLYSWPALAGAAFVFDEIHSYDSELWEALIRLLKDLPGVPVLLMTASLPARRLDELRRLLGDDLAEIGGPTELEGLPRYHRMADGDPVAVGRAEVEASGKVLWVCNTVGSAMSYAYQVRDLSPKVYHSRFRYIDRVERHKEVVEAFDPGGPPALALCTQVAEMSLDLKSATLLISELAPISALIQRLGRLNRRAVPGSARTMPFLVVEPNGSLPYKEAELDEAREWLKKLGAGPLSQAELARCWEELGDSGQDWQRGCCWLDGGPKTQVAPTRGSSPGISVVMGCDRARLRTGDDMMRLLVPMPAPKGNEWKSWPRWRGVPIAPMTHIKYDEMRGGEWR